MENRQIRIGIDVGGTFTHAVAVDNTTYKLLAHSVVPTTHFSKYSVSEGIIKAFENVIEKTGIDAKEVIFVSHSTTQATNALLEGDVAKVGVIGMGNGFEGIKAKSDTNISNIRLSERKELETENVFIDTAKENFKSDIDIAINELVKKGCKVIVASEAFSVDNPENEEYVCDLIEKQDIPSTSGHEISQLYGLKVRTRTAVVNASILPKMTETANLTNESIKKSGITAPLMIMRSDGGVMDIDQMKSRPILTLLSGPAAGIAAALMHASITDGIFLEVGGTSTDISAIKNGKSMIKSASIGGHTTFLKTLDSRTVGIGGGSMVRINEKGKVVDTGPRSAHIAGFKYFAFADPNEFKDLKVVKLSPLKDDPDDYVVLENNNGNRFALTLTDASMYLGVTKNGDYAYGNIDNVNYAFDIIGKHFGVDPKKVAEEILNNAAKHIAPVIKSLFDDYKIDSNLVSLVGGGGGCTTIVPWMSKHLGIKYVIADNAEVISAIGAAIAMLRDMVERNIMNPTADDIAAIKKQVTHSLLSMGADPNSIEVYIEIDKQKNIVRAIATGGIELRTQDLGKAKLSSDECKKEIIASLPSNNFEVNLFDETDSYYIYECIENKKGLFSIFNSKKKCIRVVNKYGSIKLQINDSDIFKTTAKNIQSDGFTFIKHASSYSESGQMLPEVYLVYGSRICDLSTVLTQEDLESMINLELEGVHKDDEIFILTKRR